MVTKQELIKWMTEIREDLTFESKVELIKGFWDNKDTLKNLLQKYGKSNLEEVGYFLEEKIIELQEKKLKLSEAEKEITGLNDKLNQLITRILNISEKPIGTFDPELKKQKGIKELLEAYSVNSLEELTTYINNLSNKKEPNQELEDFLKDNRVNNLSEVGLQLTNYEQTINDLKQENNKLKENREGVPEGYEDLETERDELAREKKTLEQEVLALNNLLNNKQQEVNNNVDIFIEPVKIEGKERSETKGMMTQNFFDLIITVSKRGENRNENPHIIGDAWQTSSGMINTYSEEQDPNPGSLTNKKVQKIIIPNAVESKKDWVGEFNQRDRNSSEAIQITGPFEKYDETTLTLTFKPNGVKLQGIFQSAPL